MHGKYGTRILFTKSVDLPAKLNAWQSGISAGSANEVYHGRSRRVGAYRLSDQEAMSENGVITSCHRKFIAEFIALYRSFSPLWDLQSPEYNDREIKRAAYTKLINNCREVEPNSTRIDVIRKVNFLRSAFRREYKK
ncbi:hypothetical protein NQ317_002572 [Molorchus minor]|uniref:MADF domain-containing protein n=1 Tax=Molorchus minor TaxID=1323400 RepID=A0ABQ9IQU9_9CUCU|nr:hypothetical protein NQ317_002572 [Molorchus minor]